jgi:glycosyltransferase involved in cell wall biosynthesis
MTNPLVSLLIRSIDRNTLKETLASVARQDYPNLEVCVVAAVPDHSPVEMPSNLTQARLVETDVALQRSAAANKALALAQGTYALFLDDDDWIAPHHVSTLVDALRNAPGFDVAYSRTQVVTPDQPASDDVVMGLPFDGLRLLAGNWMPLHSVLFSLRLRDLGCRFDEKLALYEDWDFWLQAAQHSDFLYVPVVSAFYRIHDSSGVHDQVRFRGDAFGMVYDKWRRLWSQEQLSEMMYRVWQHEDLSKTSQSSKEEALQAGKALQAERARVQALTDQQRDLKKAHAEELEAIFKSRC